MAAAGAVVALGLEPVLGPEAAGVLAVPQEGLVVHLQAAQGLPLLLRLQRPELQAAPAAERAQRAPGPRDASLPSPAPLGRWATPTVTRDQERMSCRSRLRLCHASRLVMSTCSWCHRVTRAWCWASSLRVGARSEPWGRPPRATRCSCRPLAHPPGDGLLGLLVGRGHEEAHGRHGGLAAGAAEHLPVRRLRGAQQLTLVALVHGHLRGPELSQSGRVAPAAPPGVPSAWPSPPPACSRTRPAAARGPARAALGFGASAARWPWPAWPGLRGVPCTRSAGPSHPARERRLRDYSPGGKTRAAIQGSAPKTSC